jgi:hypothetical protein
MDEHIHQRQLDSKQHRMDKKLYGETQHNKIGSCAKNLMKSIVSRDSADKKVEIVYFCYVTICL